MSLAPGDRLGHYEVLGLIDQGGMGAVYKAQDTRLKRSVAIKVLPDAVSADPDRLIRFQREAEVLASLNHSNIAQVFGLEKTGATTALVMELVEGETLADRIGRGLIPLEDALPIARQIADALEAAHEQSIIHRDLKPANVKVRPDGTVKVLDFGLAKALEPNGPSADISDSPTMTSPAMTQAGVILGTAAYMSPEQAKGKAVDKRTDIWAFGCVLYEMLTGHRAFGGEDLTDTLAAIVRGEPDWAALPPNTPPPIRQLMEGCLQKDRKARVADVAVVRFALGAASHPIPASAVATPAPLVKPRLTWRDLLLAIGVLILVSGAGSLGWWWRTPATLPETRLEIAIPLTSVGSSTYLAISPDATHIVFIADSNGTPTLWLRPLNKTVSVPIAGTEGGGLPFWSPNSQSIGFVAQQKLKRLDLAGGGVQTIAEANSNNGAAWSPSDVILYSKPGSNELWRVPASGGTPAVVTRLSGGLTGFLDPQFLPDGQHFICRGTGPADVQGLYLGSLNNTSVKRLTDADSGGRFIPPGWIAYVRQDTLVAHRLDLTRETLADEILPIAENIYVAITSRRPAVSVSATGVIAYRPAVRFQRQLMWFDRSGKPLGTLGPIDDTISQPALSHDGRRVAIQRTVQGVSNIWLIDEAGHFTPFTSDPSGDALPLWSPDDSQIGFRSTRQGKLSQWVKSASGSGDETLLADGPTPRAFSGMTDWKGNNILVNMTGDIWFIDVSTKKAFPFIDGTPAAEGYARFSPDGRWVAYQSNETTRAEIYVRPFQGSSRPVPVSTAGGAQPSWSKDGKELYWIAPDSTLMAAKITETADSIEPGAPFKLFQTRIYLGGTDNPQRHQYAVAEDGRFLINTVVGDDAVPPIVVIHNWRGK
jgi:serine/threonine protein kinase